VDRQRNDRLGWTDLSECFQNWWQILRRCTERDTHANTFSDPNRDSYANGNSYANSECDTWTDPAQGSAKKGGRNKYGATQLEGRGALAQHRHLPQ
jgi:hypothetical protein